MSMINLTIVPALEDDIIKEGRMMIKASEFPALSKFDYVIIDLHHVQTEIVNLKERLQGAMGAMVREK